MYEADREASASVYNELIDEWSNQFPEIEKLLTVLQTIQVETFSYIDFSNKYDNEFSSPSEGKKERFDLWFYASDFLFFGFQSKRSVHPKIF